MHISLLKNKTECGEWDQYVQAAPEGRSAYLSGWKNVFEKSFHISTFYLFVKGDNNAIQGILPLGFLKSALFGRYFVSVPYLNYGGVIADNGTAEGLLVERAIDIAKKHRGEHIEFRLSDHKNCVKEFPCKQNKVAMMLELPVTSEILWKTFKSKLRSQIKRAMREKLEFTMGGLEALDNFYKVFSVNMRDIGTPVYGKKFFENILKEFPEKAHVFYISLEGKAIAASIVFGFKDTLEVPWASSLYSYNRLGANMLLYWKMLEFAIEKGYKKFDFGRSSVDSGTYKFKQQWGAQPQQLYWYYWLQNGQELPQLNTVNPKYKFAIHTWTRLPVWLTRIVGPHIVKNLP